MNLQREIAAVRDAAKKKKVLESITKSLPAAKSDSDLLKRIAKSSNGRAFAQSTLKKWIAEERKKHSRNTKSSAKKIKKAPTAKKEVAPIKLVHGSRVALKELRLPKKHDYARAADGHAVYLTTHEGEAATYGPHLHEVHFHAKKSELIDLDAPLTKQSPRVRKMLNVIHPILAKMPAGARQRAGVSKGGPAMQDVILAVGKEIGAVELTRLLAEAGIKGGYGKTNSSTVYTSYAPERDTKIIGSKHVNASQPIEKAPINAASKTKTVRRKGSPAKRNATGSRIAA